mmetsp:Transcript_111056/g.166312  ORF Transcript_111056/g.166312 Transcript_111056/m.166312 type:complete len:210 (-) Transcript_111056:104-733(-)
MGVGSSALHAMPATSHTRVLVAPPSLTSSRYQNPVASSRKGAGRSGSTVNSSMLLSCRHRSSVLIFSRNLLIWNCVFRSRSPVWYVIASRTVDIRSGYRSMSVSTAKTRGMSASTSNTTIPVPTRPSRICRCTLSPLASRARSSSDRCGNSGRFGFDPDSVDSADVPLKAEIGEFKPQASSSLSATRRALVADEVLGVGAISKSAGFGD